MPADRLTQLSEYPAPRRDYVVVLVNRKDPAVQKIVWEGGCRNCAHMIAAAAQRDAPEARVYIK